jgi:hypothetical protein
MLCEKWPVDVVPQNGQGPALLSSFNLSNSIFIRLKIRIDVNMSIS